MDTTDNMDNNGITEDSTTYNYDDVGDIHCGMKHTEEFEYDDSNAPRVSMDTNGNAVDDIEDELTLQTLQAVSTERSALYKENTTRLQSILESIKNSTKTVLSEMNVYLTEMEEVEKTYIKCRAKTQAEGRRLESVAPDVAGATESFLNQAGAGLFGLDAAMGGGAN